MIIEDYVSFETAKLLKEKGFVENTPVNYFVGDDKPRGCAVGEMIYHKRLEEDTHLIAAPTLQMAMKWLREVHNLWCEISWEGKGLWCMEVFSLMDEEFIPDSIVHEIKSYEEACESAIKYCLENLI